MKNIKKLYYYSIINRTNLIILGISLLLMILLFSLWDYDRVDYIVNYDSINRDYLKNCIMIIEVVLIVLIALIIAIDNIFNSGKFDSLFINRISIRYIRRMRINCYIIISIIWSSILFLIMILIGLLKLRYMIFSFYHFKIYILLVLFNIEAVLLASLFIRILKISLASILIIFMFLTSFILGNITRVGSNAILINIDVNYISIFQYIYGIFVVVVLYILLDRALNKGDYKSI